MSTYEKHDVGNVFGCSVGDYRELCAIGTFSDALRTEKGKYYFSGVNMSSPLKWVERTTVN